MRLWDCMGNWFAHQHCNVLIVPVSPEHDLQISIPTCRNSSRTFLAKTKCPSPRYAGTSTVMGVDQLLAPQSDCLDGAD